MIWSRIWSVVLPVAAALVVALLSARARAITIQIDYSYDVHGFFNTQDKRDLMQVAADTLAVRLVDNLLAITPNVPAGNTWTASFFNPADDSIELVDNMTIPADTLIVFVGGQDLGASTLASGATGGWSATGSTAFRNSVASRGQGVTQGPTANDFGPWGGSITFSNHENIAWSFTQGLPLPNTYDFFSVAMHEMAHVLGFGLTDSWDRLVSGNSFTGPNSVAEFGANVPLSGDKGHWANGTMSDGRETALDPSLATGTRKGMTSLDWAGLVDVGWTLAPLGIPGDVNDDGIVDIADILTVGAHWQTPGPIGDTNGDSIVDIADVLVIGANWQQGGGGGGASLAVPEPSSWALGLLAALALAGRGGARRRLR